MTPDLETLVAAARAAVPTGLVSIYVFGSHAANRAHQDSDVDIAVLLDSAVYPSAATRFDIRLILIARLDPLAGINGVDLVVLNDAPPPLVRRIMTQGRRLLCTDIERDHEARRLALSRAADLEPFLRRTRRILLD